MNDKEKHEIANIIAADSSGSMNGLVYPDNWDEISEGDRADIEYLVYNSYMDTCCECGWDFIWEDLNWWEGESICGMCEYHKGQEEDEEE